MIITFLGTGTSQGVPVIGCNCEVCTSKNPADNRLRSSVHILNNENSIVIDTGPDFRQQMLREKVNNLDAVLFTHHHKDHIAGMDDMPETIQFIKEDIIDGIKMQRQWEIGYWAIMYMTAINQGHTIPKKHTIGSRLLTKEDL